MSASKMRDGFVKVTVGRLNNALGHQPVIHITVTGSNDGIVRSGSLSTLNRNGSKTSPGAALWNREQRQRRSEILLRGWEAAVQHPVERCVIRKIEPALLSGGGKRILRAHHFLILRVGHREPVIQFAQSLDDERIGTGDSHARKHRVLLKCLTDRRQHNKPKQLVVILKA